MTALLSLCELGYLVITLFVDQRLLCWKVVFIREENIGKAKLPHISNTHRIQNAVEMIAFVLNDARMKPLDRSLNGLAVSIETAIAQKFPARHQPA